MLTILNSQFTFQFFHFSFHFSCFSGFGSVDHQLFLEAFASLGPLVNAYKLPDLTESMNEDNNNNFNNNDNNKNNYDDNKNKKFHSIQNNSITKNSDIYKNMKILITFSIIIIAFVFLCITMKNYFMRNCFRRKINSYEYVSVEISESKNKKNNRTNGNKNKNKIGNDDDNEERKCKYGSLESHERTKKYYIQSGNEMNNQI